jgi:exodeoxyribonuclease V beta subunit
MSRIVNITDSKEIDLLRHGVIEAHAGTGKTYAIVKMVVRILEEPLSEGTPVHLRQILLVTFTDKAAGELKKRIREGLEDRIRELRRDGPGAEKEVIAHLENCLNNLHEAFIGTIHSVCLRLLRTWPFETGVQFKTEMVDDTEGLGKELRSSMRTDWQDESTHIPWALERLQAEGGRFEKKHFEGIVAMAGELLDMENTVLDRRICFNSIADLKKQEDECSAASEQLKKTLHQLIGTAKKVLENPAGLNDKRIEGLSGMIKDWEFCLEQPVVSPELVLNASWVKKDARFKFDPGRIEKEFAIVSIVNKNPPVQAFAEEYRIYTGNRNWAPVLDLPNVKSKLLVTLLCDAAGLLCNRWNRAKQEKGLVSFQDMLRLMHGAVMNNENFRGSLRDRLRFGIIDEFQDTSTLQWKIFEKIFLDGPGENGPRLFIVGDPKQAIFGFQGADVQSYLDAKSAIEKHRGQVYGLVNNYRSLPETIDGYNTIIGREKGGPDWFGFDGAAPGTKTIAYPDEARGGLVACPPARADKLPVTLKEGPVQVMVLEGSAGVRRSTMARWAGLVIRSLVGKKIIVPNGDAWKEITLEYRDFAVIVESHSAAWPFLEQFQEDGIPAVKYKIEGVFQSPMARDLHAVLRAVLHSRGSPAPRLAALLTVFFNRRPADIDPEKDLEFCLRDAGCRGDRLCIAHALEEWTFFAERHRWPQLFSSIEQLTGVRERLIRLADGERHLADLRQVIDYCVEMLCRGNLTLEQLVEHLERLLNGEESAGRDRNLYSLATDRSSVRVLTMHAAKGLEFPVVFAVPGSSDKPKKGMVKAVWIGDDHKRHVLPAAPGEKIEGLFENEMAEVTSWRNSENGIENIPEKRTPPELQSTRERRRLLYVALTRAQAMLFVPAQVQKKAENPLSCGLPSTWPDRDLTPRLLHLLAEGKLPQFDAGSWEKQAKQGRPVPESDDHLDPAWTMPEEAQRASDEIKQRIARLNLSGAIRRQTSYTELSSRAATGREIDRSEEEGPEGTVYQKPALPGGAETGDALHCALEELLRADKKQAGEIIDNMEQLVRKYLERNGVLNKMDDDAARQATAAAAGYVKGAFETRMELPGGGTAAIAELETIDRIPEMEFMLGVGNDWVHGYMDLVFRVKNKTAKHRYRYYVLDWKSDVLENYDSDTILDCIVERHYDLQAKIYSNALDKYLRGLLGKEYDPKENLGGSVYVFLRGLAGPGRYTWSRIAEPESDARYTGNRLELLKKT